MNDPRYNIPMTAGDISKRRAIADAMMQRSRTPQNVGEGLDAASRSIMGALLARNMGRADAALEAKNAAMGSLGDFTSFEGDALFGDLTGGASGGGGLLGSSGGTAGPMIFEPAGGGMTMTSDPNEALRMGGGPSVAAGAMFQPPPSQADITGALLAGNGPTQAAGADLARRQLPPVTGLPKWF